MTTSTTPLSDCISRPGKLITFEGIDGCGKTTQAKLLQQQLIQEGYDVVVLREPGGTEVGEDIRRLLKYTISTKCPETELLLFLAARAQLVLQVLRPCLEAGRIVILDRFIDSTVAYQGAGKGLDVAMIRRLNEFATGGLEPDMTIYLDMPVAVARRRLAIELGRAQDAFDILPSDFFERVRGAYLGLAEQHQRIRTVAANEAVVCVAAEVRAHLLSCLPGLRAPDRLKFDPAEMQRRSAQGGIGADMPEFKCEIKYGSCVIAPDIDLAKIDFGGSDSLPPCDLGAKLVSAKLKPIRDEFDSWVKTASAYFTHVTGLEPNTLQTPSVFVQKVFPDLAGSEPLRVLTRAGQLLTLDIQDESQAMRLAYRQENGALILAEPKSDAHAEWVTIAAGAGNLTTDRHIFFGMFGVRPEDLTV